MGKYLLITSVLATPNRRTTLDALTSHASEAFDIEPSVDGISEAHSALVGAAAASKYWVCIVVSQRGGRYGWSQGSSESSALKNAKSKCGKKDCSIYSCQERGCVGVGYGVGLVVVSRAYGYGRNDGPKAASKVLSTCKLRTYGCGKPGYYCAKYIL
jgi:hypothetical protein